MAKQVQKKGKKKTRVCKQIPDYIMWHHMCALVKSRIVQRAWTASKRTAVDVEAVSTVGNTCVGALQEVVTASARDALVATAPNAGLTQGGAFLAALPVVTEKATGALGNTHPEATDD